MPFPEKDKDKKITSYSEDKELLHEILKCFEIIEYQIEDKRYKTGYKPKSICYLQIINNNYEFEEPTGLTELINNDEKEEKLIAYKRKHNI